MLAAFAWCNTRSGVLHAACKHPDYFARVLLGTDIAMCEHTLHATLPGCTTFANAPIILHAPPQG